MSQNVAPVKWAQRTDSVYLTISLPDVSNETINLTDRGLTFTGTSEGKSYHVELEFFKEIEASGSVWKVLPASVQMKLNKKATEDEFWPRLLLDKSKEKTNVTVDWNKWVDEDEGGDEEFNMDALNGGNQFGMPGMGGMGGMPGMGGMGGMPGMGGMGGMGGMPGMGGMDFGGMDFSKMAAQFGQGNDEDDDEGVEGDSDDEENLADLAPSSA